MPKDWYGLAVIVVGSIMAMSMQRPVQILGQTMRMPMFGDHLHMVLDRLEHIGRVTEGRNHGPDAEREAQQR